MNIFKRINRLAMGFLAVIATVNVMAGSRSDQAEIEAREKVILGAPPRIEPLAPSALDAEKRAAVQEIWDALGSPPREDMPEYFLTMLRHPQLMLRQSQFSVQLFRGELPVRERELAILRLAWLLQAPYEWGEHVRAGKRVGLSSDEIERITIGSSAPGWSEHERAIMRAVEELHADAMISDPTWKVLARTWNEKQLLEFPVLVGFYQSIAYLQNSVRFRLEKNNQGLSAR